MGENERKCERCGAYIDSDAPDGLCPHCELSLNRHEYDSEWRSRLTLACNALLLFRLGELTEEQWRTFLRTVITSDSAPTPLKALGEDVSTEKIAEAESLVKALVDDSDARLRWLYEYLDGPAHMRHIFDAPLEKDEETRFNMEGRLGFGRDTELGLEEQPGRYSWKSEHSRGGMGRILLVHDELLRRDIALKELLPAHTESETPNVESPLGSARALMSRFIKEARVTGRLEHPSIVPVYELGHRASGAVYYTMKFVKGRTFRKALDSCGTLQNRLNLLPHFLDLCLGIGYAHSKGVVHRDIKPDNVLVGEFGETVVIDWGLAKILGKEDAAEDDLNKSLIQFLNLDKENPTETQSGEILGTPHYMSPEQARGKIHLIDERSDVFSLGIMLYQILTNELPFESRNIAELIGEITEDDPEPITRHAPLAPRELVGICMKALSKDRAHRYRDAKEFADDLQRFLSGAIVEAYNYTLADRTRRAYSRNPRAYQVAGAAILTVIAITAFSFQRITQSRDDAIVARNQEAQARIAEMDSRERAARGEYAAQISLANQYIDQGRYGPARDALVGTQESERGWEWEWLTAKASPTIHEFTGFQLAAFQPEGQDIYSTPALAMVGMSNDLAIRNLESNTTIATLPDTKNFVISLEWNPQGTQLIAGTKSFHALLWDIASGRQVRLAGHDRSVHSATFDRTGAMAVTASFDGQVRFYDVSALSNEEELEPVFEIQSNREGLSGMALGRANNRNVIALWLMDAPDLPFEVQLWEWTPTQAAQLWTVEGNRPTFSSNGEEVFIIRSDRIVALDTFTGEERPGLSVDSFSGHDINASVVPFLTAIDRTLIEDVEVSDDGRFVCSIDRFGSVLTHDAETGAVVAARAFGSDLDKGKIEVLPGANRFAVIDLRGRGKVFDFEGDAALFTFGGHERYVPIFKVDGTGERILTGAVDDSLRIWHGDNDGSAERLRTVAYERARTMDARLNMEAQRLVGAGPDGLVLHGLESNDISYVNAVPWSRALAGGTSEQRGIDIVSTDGFALLALSHGEVTTPQVLPGFDSRVTAITPSRSGTSAWVATWNGALYSWDLATGETRLIEEFPSPLVKLRTHPQSEVLYAVSDEGTLISINNTMRSLEFDSPMQTLALNPDGSFIAVGGAGGLIEIVESEEFVAVAKLRGHSFDTEVTNLAFSADGKRLVSAPDYGDGIRVWRTRDWRQLFLDPNNATTMGFSDDANVLIHATRDGVFARGDFREPGSGYEWNHAAPQRVVLVQEQSEFTVQLQQLIRQSSQESSMETTQGGVVVRSDVESLGTFRSPLQPGDLVVRVQGEAVATREQLADQLQSQIDMLDEDAIVVLTWNIVRDANALDVAAIVQPMVEREREIEMARADAVELVERFHTWLRRGRRSWERGAREWTDRMELAGLPEDSLVGLKIRGPDNQFTREDYMALGLAPDDVVTHINDTRIDSIRVALDTLKDVSEQLENANTEVIEMSVRRGEFQTVRYKLRIE